MRPIFAALAAAVVLAAAAPAAPVPKDLPKTDADRLVGTWKLGKTTPAGPTAPTLEVEFTRDGKVTLRKPGADPEIGTYKVTGKTVEYTLSPGTDAERAGEDEIKKLTDDELVLIDKGSREEYVRVKPDGKKADKK